MSFDNEITASAERLQSCGVRETGQAHKNLDLLKKTLGAEAFAELLPSLLSHLSVSADPDTALNNFERFSGGLSDIPSFLSLCRSNPGLLASLVTVFGASRFLSAFLFVTADRMLPALADPAFLTSTPGKERLAERLNDAVGSDAGDKNFFQALRIFRKQELLRIGLRDLLNRADVRETVEDLSDLAEVCLQKACEWAEASVRSRYGRPMIEGHEGGPRPAAFAVIAMGKLGGRELNFSSDVDLMYVYTADGETEGTAGHGGIVNRTSNHQYFIKLAEKLSAAIGEKTEDGFVFRVDLRLRPEGQRGPLAQSLGGYEVYYESWGQTWERSALIKARPVAGDEALGREFMERITPLVFRKYLDFSAIAEIRDMKQRINKDVELKGGAHRDVKLGYGGIREIEFVVQALQLIYAGRDRSLRERSTLKALHMLSQKGLITYQEHAALAGAYAFLRTVEHRIQITDDLQTQTMPSGERELRSLARSTGYLERGRESELLLRDYNAHSAAVRAIYDDLFAFTGEQDRGPAGDDSHLIFDPQTPEPEATALLRKHGFIEPEKAYRNVLLLREGTAFVHQTPRSRKLFHEIFPALFHEIAASPDPDMALNHLESFLSAQGSWEAFQSLVRIEPSAVRVLVTIFASSEYFSRMLAGRRALLENLVESRKAYGTGTSAVFARELADVLSRAPGVPEKLDALRRFKHQEEIRLGMADLASGVSQRSVSRDLSKLAEVCVDAALHLALSEVGRRYHDAAFPSGLAVIGAGKLGGRELTYGSDLDILFVYSEKQAQTPAEISSFEFFSKTAEKTIAYLSSLTREGFAFRVDTRLRPTGSKGPLVQSIDAFKSYYSGQAETWELQALLRARPVAGDRSVGEEFCEAIQPLVFRAADRDPLAADIRNMRRRMEEEIGRKSDAYYNIKQGEGGIVDIDFLVQYLQLLYGKRHPRIRVPGTHDALRAVGREGLMDPEDHQFLLGAYLFLRRLESRMRIVSNQASTELSRNPQQLRQLARRMGYDDQDVSAGEQLINEYERLSRRVRALFDRTLS